MSYQKTSLILGFSLWFVATLIFRFYGSSFFLVENIIVMVAFYFGIIPVLFFFVSWFFRKFGLSKTERMRSAVLMTLPGMVLDTLCIKFYWLVFPTFSQEEAITLGSWVLWVYTTILLIGFFPKKTSMSQHIL